MTSIANGESGTSVRAKLSAAGATFANGTQGGSVRGAANALLSAAGLAQIAAGDTMGSARIKLNVLLAGGTAMGPATGTFTVATSAGSQILTFTGLGSGETATAITPNDGHVAIAGSGTTLAVGLTSSSIGTISYTVTTSLGRTFTIAVSATSATPTTATFTDAQVGQGWTFLTNRTADANNIQGSSDNGQGAQPGTVWAGYVTGTAFYARGNPHSYAIGSGYCSWECSVDGGAFAQPIAETGDEYTFFTGLSDTKHLVLLRPSQVYGDGVSIPRTGNPVMRVTGLTPTIETYGGWAQPGDADGRLVVASRLIAGRSGRTPATVPSGVPHVMFSADFTKLVIVTDDDLVGVSIDGGAPTYYQPNRVGGGLVVVTGLSGTHRYNVWASGTQGAMLAVSGSGGTGFLGAPATKRLHQYGDSITYSGSASPAQVSINGVAATLGRAGCNIGVAGWKTADLNGGLDTWLPQLTVTSADVAVIAIGYNDESVSFTAAVQTQYQSIVTKLKAKGYGKIIARAVLDATGSDSHSGFNNGLQSFISGLNDPTVVYGALSNSGVIDTPDSTHPSALGYTQLRPKELTLYQSLGL